MTSPDSCAGGELLILLDNFEHLLDAAPAVSAVLACVARSSRARHEPGAAARLGRARSTGWSRSRHETQLRSSPSGHGSRSRTSRPTQRSRRSAVRLDGLPLAIELAAARTKLLAPERLLERLDSALPLLTGGARDAPERQRTLRATIDWSYDLLDAASSELFARSSVFAGGFPLDAAEDVCGADLDSLAALVDSSLLKPTGDDRFLMLETIREYALERLARASERQTRSLATRGFFSDLAARSVRAPVRRRGGVAARLEADHDDLRAALDRQSETPRPGRLARLVLDVALAARRGGRQARGGTAGCDAAAPQPPGRSWPPVRLPVSEAGATRPRSSFRSGIAALAHRGDDRELATALDMFGWFLFFADENDRGLAAFEESLELWR